MIKKDDFHLPAYAAALKRGGPATTHPKDAGLILAYSGLDRDSRVLELGCGSGYMTVTFGRITKEVIAYEKKPEFLKIAKENVRKNNLQNVVFKEGDLHEILSEDFESFDVVSVDIADAERVVEKSYNYLKRGGCFVGHCLQMEQAKKLQLELQKYFDDVWSMESLVREYEAREFGFRPKHFGLTYTAIMVFARK